MHAHTLITKNCMPRLPPASNAYICMCIPSSLIMAMIQYVIVAWLVTTRHVGARNRVHAKMVRCSLSRIQSHLVLQTRRKYPLGHGKVAG